MTSQPGRGDRRYAYVAAAIILAAVILSATILASSQTGRTATLVSTTTLTSSSTGTVTVVRTTPVAASPTSSTGSYTGSSGPVTLYRTNGDWNFTVTLNSTAVTRGQVIAALLNLTNISGQNQTVHVVGPLYDPAVYSQNGSLVWEEAVSEINFNTNWTYGPGVAQEWDVPTSSLHPGQTYILNLWPFIGPTTSDTVKGWQYLIGEDLMINATFTVS